MLAVSEDREEKGQEYVYSVDKADTLVGEKESFLTSCSNAYNPTLRLHTRSLVIQHLSSLLNCGTY